MSAVTSLKMEKVNGDRLLRSQFYTQAVTQFKKVKLYENKVQPLRV